MDIFLSMWLNGSVLIAVILCFRHFFSHQVPKRFIVFLWIFAMARLLLPISVPVRWNVPGFRIPGAESDSQKKESDELDDLLMKVSVHTDTIDTDTVDTGRSEAYQATGLALKRNAWLSGIVFIVWLAVAVLLAVKILVKHIRSRKIYNLSLPVCEEKAAEWLCTHRSFRTVTMRSSELAGSPLTYGIFRPVILLPSEIKLSEEEFLCVMEHEWNHIRWWDVLVKYILYLTVCIYWFHPLVWVMAALLNRDMEMACDEEVVRKYSDSLRTTYALILIRLAEGRRGATGPANACFASTSEIEERIQMIMKTKKYSRKAFALALVMICCAATTFTTAAQETRKEADIVAEDTDLNKADEADNKAEKIGDKVEIADSKADEADHKAEMAGDEVETANHKADAARSTAKAPSAAGNEQVAKLAADYIGAPYQFGGTDLSSGVDSPGFVKAVYGLCGIELPGDIQKLAASGTEISLEELSAGDIIFYGEMDENQNVQLSHTGIYNGDGQVIHASNMRDGVKVSDYNYREISMAVRILK